jgi:ABC-type molybdenum transport system ATPase subunit/photorepair protein PhrA
MDRIMEWISGIDLESIGIQKHLIVAALIGTLLNIPKNIKSKIQKTTLVILTTIMCTILTPLVLEVLANMGWKVSQGSSFAIAGLIGVIGISTLKKYIVDKLNKNKDE